MKQAMWKVDPLGGQAFSDLTDPRQMVLLDQATDPLPLRKLLREELGVELAPYLNGMAESIGEGRRAILDMLRRSEVEAGERILRDMEDMYDVLVTIDFPDAITGNLRRSTDVARGIMERTRGDLSMVWQWPLRWSLSGPRV